MGDLDAWADPIGSYADAELSGWADSGASPPTLEGAVRGATRARLLRMAIGPSFGAAVERGLAAADVSAALSLAAAWVADDRQYEAKRLALWDHASSPGSDLVGAMIRTALRHDELRLGLVESSVIARTPEAPVVRRRASNRSHRCRGAPSMTGQTARPGPARGPTR